MPSGFRAIQLPDTKVKSDFMDILGRPPRVITCECERSQEPNMAQALMFINGDLINRKVTAQNGLVDKLIKSGKNDGEILDELYWTAFGRPPSSAERASDLTSIHKALAPPTVTPVAAVPPAPNIVKPIDNRQSTIDNSARRRVFEDMRWVLVNSKEFLFNH